MRSTYRVKASELDERFVQSLRALYDEREIEIEVMEVGEIQDETEYLMSSPENKRRLLEAIDDIKNNRNLIQVDADRLGDIEYLRSLLPK